MQNLKVPSFFFTNNTGAPHEETFGRINFVSHNYCNWILHLTNSVGTIMYGAFDVGWAFGINSVSNLTSLSRGKSGR